MKASLPDWAQFLLVASGIVVFVVLLALPTILQWRKIARLYPDGPFTAERVYYSVAGALGERGNSHHLAVGKQGLRLFAVAPLRRMLPPILIPWAAIYRLQGKPSSWGSDSLIVEISRPPLVWRIWFLWRHGEAISVIQQCWEKYRSGEERADGPQSKSGLIVVDRG